LPLEELLFFVQEMIPQADKNIKRTIFLVERAMSIFGSFRCLNFISILSG